jgi:branched-chain amino acid transport system ATP-binding protein
MAEPLLAVEDLQVRYGRSIEAVRGVSFQLSAGESLALIGPNGAGKTTTVRAISGVVPGQSSRIVGGRVVFDGKDRVGNRASKLARLGLVFIPERDKIFVNLSVQEHLLMARRVAVAGEAVRQEDLEMMFGDILRMRGSKAGELSGGQRQLLALMCAVVRRPKVLIVDELSLGLSPAAVKRVAEGIRWAREATGLALLMVEQDAALVSEMCRSVTVMRAGEAAWSGASEDLTEEALTGWYFN